MPNAGWFEISLIVSAILLPYIVGLSHGGAHFNSSIYLNNNSVQYALHAVMIISIFNGCKSFKMIKRIIDHWVMTCINKAQCATKLCFIHTDMYTVKTYQLGN